MAAEHPFLSWLGQAVVIAAGWYVVHKLTDRRDREKTRREVLIKIVDTLSEDLDEILSSAREYHSFERKIGEELKIKMDLQDLGIRINALSDVYPDQVVLALARSKLASLRRAVTGNHFEDEHTAPLAADAPQQLLIVEAVLDLKRVFVTIKNRQLQL